MWQGNRSEHHKPFTHSRDDETTSSCGGVLKFCALRFLLPNHHYPQQARIPSSINDSIKQSSLSWSPSTQPPTTGTWRGSTACWRRKAVASTRRFRGGTPLWTMSPSRAALPLHLAAWRGHDAVVARLLGLGADVGLRDSSPNGYMATHWACVRDRVSCLALLLDAGASFNERGGNAWTPLMKAAWNGATECVKLLLARGGDALELDGVSRSGDGPAYGSTQEPRPYHPAAPAGRRQPHHPRQRRSNAPGHRPHLGTSALHRPPRARPR
jgi:hypothetical protein